MGNKLVEIKTRLKGTAIGVLERVDGFEDAKQLSRRQYLS